jgi:hypothetical protein
MAQKLPCQQIKIKMFSNANIFKDSYRSKLKTSLKGRRVLHYKFIMIIHSPPQDIFITKNLKIQEEIIHYGEGSTSTKNGIKLPQETS